MTNLKNIVKFGFIVLMMGVISFGNCLAYANASSAEMDAAGHKLNIARSDYLEAIAACNGALRKSAERQMDRILADIAAKKDRAKNDYESMSRNLTQIYQELAQHFDDPIAAKKFLDMAMGFVPVLGQAYGIADSIYEYADESVRADAGREVFNRAKQQIREMEKVSREYNDWKNLEQDVQRQKAQLGRQFDKNCRGRDTDEWRYDTDGDVLQQSGQIDVELKGNDVPSGEVFQGTIQNNTGTKINVQFPSGAIFFPEAQDTQRMIITLPPSIFLGPGEQTTVPFGGFCLDPQAFPPSAGTPEGWFIGAPVAPINSSPFNQEFSQVPSLSEIIPGLFVDETLTPTGLPKQMEEETITQWTIWNILEGFTPEDGEKKITEQVEESGGTQTPEQIKELNENIWGNINLVKKKIREDIAPIDPRYTDDDCKGLTGEFSPMVDPNCNGTCTAEQYCWEGPVINGGYGPFFCHACRDKEQVPAVSEANPQTQDVCESISDGNGTVDPNCNGKCSSTEICQAKEPALNTAMGSVMCYFCQYKNVGPTLQEQMRTLKEGIDQREKALKKMPNNVDDSLNQALRKDIQDSINLDKEKLKEIEKIAVNEMFLAPLQGGK